MNKKRIIKNFLTIVIIIAAAFLSVVIFKTVTRTDENGRDIKTLINYIIYGEKAFRNAGLPSCGDKKELFSYYPVALENIARVTPQGEFSPSGGHVFPVKHVYTLDKYSSTPDNGTINRPAVEMVAPADMTVTLVSKYWDKNRGYEYYISFSPCKEIFGDFFHLSDISPKLKQAFEGSAGHKADINAGTTDFKTTSNLVRVAVKAGEVIGTASVKSTQLFDFNLIDTRSPELQFVNKKRFSKHSGFDLLHEVCPYDYFSPEIRSRLYAMMSDYNGHGKKRTVEPLCGEYMQDIPNTAQGVWFKQGTGKGETGNKEDIIARENLHIALAHEAYDPQLPVFSFGPEAINGIEPILYTIEPKNQGLVNRDWRDITADGKIYCADLSFATDYSPVGQSIILQLPTPTTLKIEKLAGTSCGDGPWSFTENLFKFER